MKSYLIDPIIKCALEEDNSWGDVTSENLIAPETESRLTILLKEQGVVSGLMVAQRAFELVDPSIIWHQKVEEGDLLEANTSLAEVTGNAQSLLIAERVALNFLQRLSGISSLTRQYVDAANKVSDKVKILDTRKTTPGLRLMEKFAVRMGGGFNHRYNLSDSVLIKDNHIAIIESTGITLKQALKKLKHEIPHTVKVEVEVDRIDQIPDLLEIGVDTILLDNMNEEELREAVTLINGRAFAEASGGVNLERVGKIATTGIDFISVGALTHSALSLDISLDYS